MTPARAPDGGSWAAYPGAGPPEGILFLEAFGRLSGHFDLRDQRPGEGALWSVFRTRAEMMGWSSTGESEVRTHEVRWSVHEAELDSGTGSPRIGWAQVGLRAGVSPVRVLPALIQCLDGALQRFGTTDMSGLQLTASQLQPSDTTAADLVAWLGWFSTIAGPEVDALVAMDAGLLGDAGDPRWHRAAAMTDGGPFLFGPLVPVPPGHAIEVPAKAPVDTLTPAERGVAVRLPEWSTAAAAWALAFVVAAALVESPRTTAFAVRLTRTPSPSPGHRRE